MGEMEGKMPVCLTTFNAPLAPLAAAWSGPPFGKPVFSLVYAEDHSFELVVSALFLAVIAHVNRAVFIGHVSGGRGHNPVLADPGARNIRPAGEALGIGSLNGGFADNRLSVWRHVRKGIIGSGQIALLYGVFGARSRLGLRQYRSQQNEHENQAETHTFPPCEFLPIAL